MSRLLLAAALIVSVVVPGAGIAFVAAGDGGPASASGTPTSFAEAEKDEIVDLYNELVGVDELATPGSAGHMQEARRISRDAAAWATAHPEDPAWHEFASATSDVARLLALALAKPHAVDEAAYARAVARLSGAAEGLPPERRPAA